MWKCTAYTAMFSSYQWQSPCCSTQSRQMVWISHMQIISTETEYYPIDVKLSVLMQTISRHITYLLRLFGLASPLLIVIRASLLWATGVFGTSQGGCCDWFVCRSAGWRASTTAAFLVGLHEFWNELRAAQVLLRLPGVVLSEEKNKHSSASQYQYNS